MLTLSAALAYTVILATKSAYVSGTDAANAARLLREYGGSPMKYRENGRAVASVVFLWIGMVGTFARYVTSPPLIRCTCILTMIAPRFCGIHLTTSTRTVPNLPMRAPATALVPTLQRNRSWTMALLHRRMSTASRLTLLFSETI